MPTQLTVRRQVAGLILTAMIALIAGVLPTSGPAFAAPPGSPSGLSPSGQTITGAPVLQWNRTAGATSYKVQFSPDDSFTTNVTTVITVNRRYVPIAHLRSSPTGEVFWRVAARNADGESTPTTTSFFRAAMAGPTLTAPASGQSLQQPEDPPLLSWTPVQGAVSYTIQVDTDDSFVPPLTVDNKTTATTSYLIPTPLIAQTYHWQVKATMGTGVETQWSEIRTFTPTGLRKAVLTSPVDNADTKVVDVALDWEPVPGAVKYDLQISTDQNFLSGATTTVTNVVGSRYSPPTTLNNDQYWWRVRPYDAGGNFLDWGQVDVWTFQRHWPDQPVLRYPVNDAVAADPFYFQWDAVPHASRYTLQLSISPDFASIADSCITVHTTYVPKGNGDCMPGAAQSYYWRVLALDDPLPVLTDVIVSQVEHFSYVPEGADMATATPADGATVSVPTLTWEPVTNATAYQVYVRRVDTNTMVVNGVTTTGLSFTPRTALVVDKQYRWWIRPIWGSNRQGWGLDETFWNEFTLVAQAAPVAALPNPLTPPSGTTYVRFPTLTWTPVVGADYYKIAVRDANGVTDFVELPDTFPYPAGEDDGTAYLDQRSYEWIVNAYNADGKFATSSSAGLIQSVRPAAATGHRAAITGQASESADSSCTRVLPEPCPDLKTTPVLRWDPVPFAGGYMVSVSKDAEMTNGVTSIYVEQNIYLPTATYDDASAGDAYHWIVRPCMTSSSSTCTPAFHALHAFNKVSNGVELLSPADGANTKVAHSVTFTWRDWLETNTAPAGADGETGINPQLEARSYKINVATDPSFTHIIDTATVDQTSYTAYAEAYPEGPLYWRVYPIDGSSRVLTPSATRQLDKESPSPTLQSPLGNPLITRTEPFRWQPQDYASSYKIEIYKNDDPSTANRILSATSKQVAYTAAAPLAPSAKPYLWRVFAVNANGFVGEPSAFGRFTVTASKPVQVAPSIGAWVRNTDGLFSWTAVQGATSYKVERRKVGSTSLAESVRTVALAWAPIATIPDGSWEWHVLATDAAGQTIGDSGWRTFKVDATRPTVIAKAPLGKAGPSTNFVVTVSERVTNVSKTTVKRYRKGNTLPVSAVVKLSADGRKAVLNPMANLRRGTTYIARLTSGIKDPAGNTLAALSWSVVIQ